MKVLEGSDAIGEAVRLACPQVVSAYPITPQTHIVEYLARAVAAGTLHAELVTVESEHSAASVVLGASASGVRTFTATSSQGLLYMSEVVFNIAGMRLPVVMTLANRALSAPLSIWNDHQDSMALRDAGWIQIFAQNAQEAHDLHLVAYRVAEEALVPVMVCVDGFVLTHAFEPIEPITQEQADLFLPPLSMPFALDPAHPMTLGAYTDPSAFTESRFALHQAHLDARGSLDRAFADLAAITGRSYDAAFDCYRLDDADVVLVIMGTAAQTARVVVDELRDAGTRAGLVALRTFRPFPAEQLRAALWSKGRIVVFDRSVSIGKGGIVVSEVRDALSEAWRPPEIVGVIGGLGGRDVSPDSIRRAVEAREDCWIDLKEGVLA